MVKIVYWSSGEVPIIFVRFYWNLNFLDRVSQNPQMSNFMKIRAVGAEFFHMDGRTGRHEANSRFS